MLPPALVRTAQIGYMVGAIHESPAPRAHLSNGHAQPVGTGVLDGPRLVRTAQIGCARCPHSPLPPSAREVAAAGRRKEYACTSLFTLAKRLHTLNTRTCRAAPWCRRTFRIFTSRANRDSPLRWEQAPAPTAGASPRPYGGSKPPPYLAPTPTGYRKIFIYPPIDNIPRGGI